MADEQNTNKGVGDDFESEDALDYEDDGDTATMPAEEPVEVATEPVQVVTEKAATPVIDEYDEEEPIEDYVVKLVVNDEQEQSTTVKDLIDATIADTNGNLIPSKTSEILDALDSYTTTVVNEIAGETTAITGGEKSWWSGSTRTYIIIGLIGLCILGLLLALICLFLRRKPSGNKSTTSGSTTTTKNVVNKNVAPDQKYERVPNV